MLTIKDLAEMLVQKHQLDSQSAEMFMNAIIETIHEGLKNDRIVKVKGFGTFKLTAVRDRESINVNTGERVVISGHDKVSFTPDAVLRDLVNKPFAQFDTVVLADGVDFEDMPEMDTEDADAVGEDVADIPVDVQPEAKVVAMQVAQEPEPVVVPVSEPEPVDVPVSEPEVKVEVEPEMISEPESENVSVPEVEKPVAVEPQIEEPEEPNTPDVQEEIPENPETPEIPEAPETPSKEPEQKQKQEEQEPEEVQEDYISAFYDEEDSDRRNMFLIYAIIANVIVAALFFMFGYYARSNNLLGTFTLKVKSGATYNGSKLTLNIEKPTLTGDYVSGNLRYGINTATAVVGSSGSDTSDTVPANLRAVTNSQYHQIQFVWDKVQGADKYGIAVYLAGKWRVQTSNITNNSYVTPKNLTPGMTYKVAVAARVNGKWDTNGAIKNAITVTVK